MRRPLAAVLLAAAVLAGGCGQHHRSSTSASRPGATDSSTTTAPGASGGGGGAVTSTTAKGGGSAASGTAGTATPTTAVTFGSPSSLPEGDFHSTATVSKACVNPGGKETLTVSTRAQSAVAYTTLYADGKNHGGNYGGMSGPDGKFRETFDVDATAPKGDATVYVSISAADGKHSNTTASFKVGC